MNFRLVTISVIIASVAIGAHAESVSELATPYEPDAHTLHLWHLDENTPPFVDQVGPPNPLQGLLNGARAGEPTLPGFGSSVSFHHDAGGTPGIEDFKGAILLGASELAHGPEDNMPAPFAFTGEDGAFTYEALVNLDVLPSEAKGIGLGIISMEGETDDRVFNFRIEKEGFLSFLPLTRISAAGGTLATIPTKGPHAINTTDWFHVAVTYDGREGKAGNLKLYWTRLQAGLSAANPIGQGTLTSDLRAKIGDFAIGNEARTFLENSEADPFPGRIDEVRISDVSRDPTDFAFVPLPERRPSGNSEIEPESNDKGPINLRLTTIFIDGVPTEFPAADDRLELPSGLHRLDFDFEVLPKSLGSPINIRSKLSGLDERWQDSGQGMYLLVELLDSSEDVLARSEFPAIGISSGWESSLDDSQLVQRTEAVFVPKGARSVRLTVSSGAPDTTGLLSIDDLDVLAQRSDGTMSSVWFNQSFSEGETLGSSGGKPTGWTRTGSNQAIARLKIETSNPALALVDADESNEASWTARAPLPEGLASDSAVILNWSEAYNVIAGSLHRATYVNVPSGSYTFQAIAPSEDGRTVASLSSSIFVRPPLWESPWFWPLVAASVAAIISTIIYSHLRRRARRRLRELQVQKMLSDDRARIARDMHDDLGTRITLLTMNSALIERDMESNPERARGYISRLNASSRGLVTAMDDLVWAVDPANDTLNHLGIFIARTVEEMFRDSQIRCRFRIPPVLPELPLSSDFRHHIALAVRECLHNIIRHAGPCEANLELRWEHDELHIRISDNGCGFDQGSPEQGNGLSNMVNRLEVLHGSCEIQSKPGEGTTVTMHCPGSTEKSRKDHG